MSTLLDSAPVATRTPHLGAAPAAHQSFDVSRLPGPFGAEVVGLDLSVPLANEDFARIHRAHLAHHVLVFRDQCITPDEHVRFSQRFGPLQIHVQRKFQLAGHPPVLVVSNIRENGQPIGLGDAGHFWHSDLSYKERPSLGSLANASRQALQAYPYKLFYPALGICLIVLSFNLLGDGLRDAFDPKLRR